MRIPSIEGTIYDRWGNIVHHTSEVPFTWDGVSKGKLVPPGVYVDVLEIKYQLNGEDLDKVMTGDVTVLR